MYSNVFSYNLSKNKLLSLSILCYLRKRVHNLFIFLIFMKYIIIMKEENIRKIWEDFIEEYKKFIITK